MTRNVGVEIGHHRPCPCHQLVVADATNFEFWKILDSAGDGETVSKDSLFPPKIKIFLTSLNVVPSFGNGGKEMAPESAPPGPPSVGGKPIHSMNRWSMVP